MTPEKRAMKNIPSFGFLLLLPMVLFLSSVCVGYSQEDDFQAAGIDIQQVFQEYYKTTRTERDINEERIRIQKADRQVRAQIKVIQDRIRVESEKGRDETMSEDAKAELQQKIDFLIFERDKMNRERMMKLQQNNALLDQNMMKTMQGLLEEIQRFVTSHSEESGYDIVFDISGTTTNQTPAVLGGKGIRDITASVIMELNRENSPLEEKQ